MNTERVESLIRAGIASNGSGVSCDLPQLAPDNPVYGVLLTNGCWSSQL